MLVLVRNSEVPMRPRVIGEGVGLGRESSVVSQFAPQAGGLDVTGRASCQLLERDKSRGFPRRLDVTLYQNFRLGFEIDHCKQSQANYRCMPALSSILIAREGFLEPSISRDPRTSLNHCEC